MKKKMFAILCILLIMISLTACKGKINRVDSNDKLKDDVKEETINGYTKEELEASSLPEDVFDEDDSTSNLQGDDELTEEEIESALKEITENYSDGGPIILPDDVLE